MPMHSTMAASLVGAGGWGYFSGGLAAYAQAMYSEPEHAQVAFSHVFALARDLYLHRITEEDARRKLAELSQQPQP